MTTNTSGHVGKGLRNAAIAIAIAIAVLLWYLYKNGMPALRTQVDTVGKQAAAYTASQALVGVEKTTERGLDEAIASFNQAMENAFNSAP